MSVRPIVVVVAAWAAGTAAGQIYDLRGDFSMTQNPNGPWSYNEGSNPLPFTPNWGPEGDAWAVAPQPDDGHIPAFFQAPWPMEDWQEGDIIVHCWGPYSGGNNGPANITWTAPAGGVIDLSGNTWLARNIGRMNDVSLWVNDTMLDFITLYDGDPYDRDNPYVFQGALSNIHVQAGDVVTLRSDWNPDDWGGGDFAGLNLTINFAVPAPGAGALLLLAAPAARRRR